MAMTYSVIFFRLCEEAGLHVHRIAWIQSVRNITDWTKIPNDYEQNE